MVEITEDFIDGIIKNLYEKSINKNLCKKTRDNYARLWARMNSLVLMEASSEDIYDYYNFECNFL